MSHEWLLTIECNAFGVRPDLEAFPEGDVIALWKFVAKAWDLDEDGNGGDEEVRLSGNTVTICTGYLTYLEPVIDWVMAYLIPVKMELKRLD